MRVERGGAGRRQFLGREQGFELFPLSTPLVIVAVEDLRQAAPADVTHQGASFGFGRGAAFRFQTLKQRDGGEVAVALLAQGTLTETVGVGDDEAAGRGNYRCRRSLGVWLQANLQPLDDRQDGSGGRVQRLCWPEGRPAIRRQDHRRKAEEVQLTVITGTGGGISVHGHAPGGPITGPCRELCRSPKICAFPRPETPEIQDAERPAIPGAAFGRVPRFMGACGVRGGGCRVIHE